MAELSWRDANGALRPLPEWANWYRGLGTWGLEHVPREGRNVLLLTAPVRDYAALFVALGVAEQAHAATPRIDPRNHFDLLKSLPVGTDLRFRDGRYYRCGKKVGILVREREEWVQFSVGAALYSRRADMSSDVQPLPAGEAPFVRRAVPTSTEFLEAVLPGVDVRTHYARTDINSVLVGSRVGLLREAADVELAIPSAEISGGIQDVVRLRDQPGHAYRTDILPALSDELPARLVGAPRQVVILDGALATLKWRDIDAPCLVMLVDRRVGSADAAVDAVLSDRAYGTEDLPLDGLAEPPTGIEVLAYRELS